MLCGDIQPVGDQRGQQDLYAGLNIFRKLFFSRTYHHKVTPHSLFSSCSSSIVVYYSGFLIQSHFSHFRLSGSIKSRGLQNQHDRLLCAVIGRTSASCDSQSDPEWAMPRPASLDLKGYSKYRQSLDVDFPWPKTPLSTVASKLLCSFATLCGSRRGDFFRTPAEWQP